VLYGLDLAKRDIAKSRQVVEMLRKGQGVFTLVVISGRQVQSSLVAQNTQPQQQQPVPAAAAR
jgi:hypothetical protein